MLAFNNYFKVDVQKQASRLKSPVPLEQLAKPNLALPVATIRSFYQRFYLIEHLKGEPYSKIKAKSPVANAFKSYIFPEKKIEISKKTVVDIPSEEMSISLESKSQSFSVPTFTSKINYEKLFNNDYFVKKSFESNEIIGKSTENPLYARYNPSFKHTPKEQIVHELWVRDPTSQFLFRPKQFFFSNGENDETLFCRAALYDIKSQRRMSCFAEFEVKNKNEVSGPYYVFKCDPTPNVYIGVQVSRVYQKDLDTVRFSYLGKKNAVVSLATTQKRDQLLFMHKKYKQEFFWCYCPIFNDCGGFFVEPDPSAHLSICETPLERDISENDFVSLKSPELIQRKGLNDDAELIAAISAAADPNKTRWSLKAAKTFESSFFEFECRLLDDEAMPKNLRDPWLRAVEETANPLETGSDVYVEVRAFPLATDIVPATELCNALFLRSLYVESNKHRNLICEIYFRQTDSTKLSDCEKAFVTPFGNEFSVSTRVLHDSKCSMFNEEWQIALPPDLGQKSHVLFVLSYIDCKKDTSVKELIGFAFMTLVDMNSENLIANGVHEMDFKSGQVTEGYLSLKPKKLKKLNFMLGSEKTSIRVETELHSSMMSNDASLNQLFKLTSGNHLKILESIEFVKMVSFLPSILNTLMNCISNSGIENKKFGFMGIMNIFGRLQKNQNNPDLKYSADEMMGTWARFYLHNFNDCALYLEIAKLVNYYGGISRRIISETGLISEILDKDNKKENAKESKKILDSMEFWIDCILKSLLLEYNSQKKIRADKAFTESFKELTVCLIDLASSNQVLAVIKRCISKVIEIIGALYTMIEPGSVLEIIQNLHKRLSLSKSPKTYELKREFLTLLYNHPICISVLQKGESGVSINTKITEISAKHPLAHLLLEEAAKNYTAETDTRDSINILSSLFCLFDNDASLSLNRRRDIANVYFPLIPMICAESPLKLTNDTTNRNMLTCFLWVTRNCAPALYDVWWSHCTTAVIRNFIAFLASSNRAFKYIGNDRDEIANKTYLSRETISEFNYQTKSNALTLIKSEHSINSPSSDLNYEKSVENSFSGFKGGNRKEQGLKKVRMMMLNRNKQNATMKLQNFTKSSLKELIKMEGMMTKVAVKVVYNVFQSFLMHKSCSFDLIPDVSEFLLANLELTLTHELYLDLYELIHFYLVHFGHKIFACFPEKKAERFLCRFFSLVLQYSVQPEIEIVSKSCFFIYIMAKFAYSSQKSLDLTQRALIVSLHDKGWIVNIHPLQAKLCCEVIGKTVSYGRADSFGEKDAFVPKLEKIIAMINELFTGLIDMASLANLKENCDYSHYEELIEATAFTYIYIPLIRIGWIKRLARHHESKKNFIEAAECYLHLSEIIDQELENMDRNDEDFDLKLKEKQKKLIYIGKAVENFEKGEFFERSCEITNKILVPILFNERKWAKLETLFKKTAPVYAKLTEMDKTAGFNNYGTYFLVSFFGKPFGDMDGRRFVYRAPGPAQSESFAAALQKKYEAALGEPVELLRTQDLAAAVPAAQNTLQVVCVQPAADGQARSKFERSAYKARFSFQIRWQEDGERSIARTRKKVFWVQADAVMPRRVTRSAVEAVAAETLSALRVAIDDIEARVRGLYEVCDCEPLSTSTLESVLTGTIMPQVNGGLKMYFDAFYTAEEKPKLAAEEIALFEKTIVRLMDACEYAIKLYTEQLVKQKKTEERSEMFNAICDYFEQAEMLVKKQMPATRRGSQGIKS